MNLLSGSDAAARPGPSWWHQSPLDVAALTHKGLVRANNEDAFFVYRMSRTLERLDSSVATPLMPARVEDTGYLLLVADGVGGQHGGEVASQSAIATAIELIARSPRWALRLDDPATRETEIREMFDRGRSYLAGVKEALRRRVRSDPALEGMATTLTGAYLVGRDLFLMHVGDSKGFVARAGELQKITRDHTIAQEYADQGLIAPEEVARHRYHHVLTRAVDAAEDELEADSEHVVLERGDRVLLCSDGLTESASHEEILAVLAVNPTSARAAEALVALALAHGGRDNITVIVAGWS